MRNGMNEAEKLKLFSEMVLAISKLANDPKSLEKSIKDAHAITAEEQKKLDDANEIINQAEGISVALDNRAKSVGDIEAQKAGLDKYASELDNREIAISSREKTLNTKASALARQEADLVSRESDLSAAIARNNQREADLEARDKNLTEYARDLQAKAKQASKILAG